MGKALVIVESPAKAKTINKYLGNDYVVKSSVGHIRDLPTSGSASKKGAASAGDKAKTKAKKNERDALVNRMGSIPTMVGRHITKFCRAKRRWCLS